MYVECTHSGDQQRDVFGVRVACQAEAELKKRHDRLVELERMQDLREWEVRTEALASVRTDRTSWSAWLSGQAAAGARAAQAGRRAGREGGTKTIGTRQAHTPLTD